VTTLFEDREGNLWIGSDSSLERLRDTAFVTYSALKACQRKAAIRSLSIRKTACGPPVDGELWWLKDGRPEHVTGDGLEHDVIYSIAGRNGEIWAGRERGGLTAIRYDRGPFNFPFSVAYSTTRRARDFHLLRKKKSS
jgi:hypothetical protein